jgi:hypothetical protein
MNMVPVVSDNAVRVGYDYATQVLRMTFRRGGTYDYYDVAAVLYEGMLLPHPWRFVGRQSAPIATGVSQRESTATLTCLRHSGP